MHVIKTWINSWSTTDRYHEMTRLRCILGCGCGNDALHHYLVCEQLWNEVLQILPSSPFTPPLLSSESLLIVDPSLDKFKIAASFHHGYHFARSMMKQIDQDAVDFYEIARAHFGDGFRTCLRRFGPLPRPSLLSQFIIHSLHQYEHNMMILIM